MDKSVLCGLFAGCVGFLSVAVAFDINGPLGPGGGGINTDAGTNPPIDPCEPTCALQVCSDGYIENVQLNLDKQRVCPGEFLTATLTYDSALPTARTIKTCPDSISECVPVGSYECRIDIPCEGKVFESCSANWQVLLSPPCGTCVVVGTVYYLPGTTDCGTVTGPSITVTNVYVVKGGWADLDIDSDHTHTLGNGGPDGDPFEDELESSCYPDVPEEHKFHKYVIVNDFHDTNSAPGYAVVIPGYADGFDHSPVTTADNSYEHPYQPQGLSVGNVFVPLKWNFGSCNDDAPGDETVSFGYFASPPSALQITTNADGLVEFMPAPGYARLWAVSEGTVRDKRSILDGGHYIPNGVPIPTNLLPRVIWLETIRPAVQCDPPDYCDPLAQITLTVNNLPCGPASDGVVYTPIKIDVDVDSNNDDAMNVPERTLGEDHIEDAGHLPGKLVPVNDDDNDFDGIPDYADGYDLLVATTNDDINVAEKFVPIVFELTAPIEVENPATGLERARVRLTYSASDPGNVTVGTSGSYVLPAGDFLRIWRKPGNEARDKRSILSGGDFVPAGEMSAKAFGFRNDRRVITNYVEAVATNGIMGGQRILFECDPDGYIRSPPNVEAADAVRMTVIKVDIAMDGNRDESIDFGDPDDAKYLFWVNDDYDVIHWSDHETMWHEDDDPSPDIDASFPIVVDGPSVPRNCDDDYIGETAYNSSLIVPHHCRRDLEDFTRLHIRVDNNTANLSGITYWLKFENVSSGSPSVNLFEAIDESLAYLQNGTVADQQIQKTKLLTVGSSAVQLPNSYIMTGNQRSLFILEGKTAGKGDLTIIVKINGNEVCKKAVTLELRPITKFYQVFQVATVGQNSTDVSASYNPDFTSSDDYLLFVHGFNVNATDKAYWPGTVFKRLWWQGYKGHVGFFDWPCVMFSYVNMQCYDDSEYNAWRCGSALLDRVNQLNGGGHSGKVRVLAHSQGNIVAGDALRLASGQVVHTYIATQPAIAGDHYQIGLAAYFTTYTTPNVLANYPLTSVPYLAGVSGKTGQCYDYYNFDDYALRTVGFGSWEWDNENRPNFNYWYHAVDLNVDTYVWPNEYFFYDSLLPFDTRVLAFTADRFEIFSYGAEARSRALGVLSGLTDFTAFNLQSTPLNYNSAHYSHSRQFRSNIVDERAYWNHVKADCGF